MFGVLIILFIIVAVFKNKAELEKKAEEKGFPSPSARHAKHATNVRQPNRSYNDPETYTQNRSFQSRLASARRYGSDAGTLTDANGRQYASQILDSKHYHSEGYDFETCFSFKDVPEGRDELSYLIKVNTRHEKELEKLLQVRD